MSSVIDSNPIDLPRLKELIHNGVGAIPIDKENKEAVIVIGDTGVGKSTIMSFLNGSDLVVKFDGLKPTLDNMGKSSIIIGHQKYSETSIPTKVVIGGMAFYDCPGFKDNKGEEYEISNSFFIQRLLDIYKNVKIVLIIDESHISEARADKLPKLVRNLHKAFKTFDDIKDGVVMVINRVLKENTVEDYHRELNKMLNLKNENGYLFQQEERNFMQFLIKKGRVTVFRQAFKDSVNEKFRPTQTESNILNVIKNCTFVKSKHIENILSESAKLSIRDFIDEITTRSNYKIEIICAEIIDIYSNKVKKLGRDIGGILALKETIIKLAEEIKMTQKEKILEVLQREVPREKIQDFEEDFASVLFFKGIYDKTNVYFSNLVNKIYSELSHLLTQLDKRITSIQKENQQEAESHKEIQQQKIREEKRQQEKIIAMEHCQKMDDLKIIAQKLCSNKKSLIEQIKAAIRNVNSADDELQKVKAEAMSIKRSNKEFENEFERIEQTYFRKTTR